MANYSRFYGEVLFYNKKIKNTEDNRIRFKKFLVDFIEYNDSRNPSFELCDDIYFDEESEYVKTTRMFFNSESNMDMRTSFIPYTAQHINEIDEDYFYYDFNTVYGIDMFLKAMFTSIYDDIVNYHYEKMIRIPELILRIMHSNYLEYDDQLQDFLLLAKEIFGKYAHEKNFSPESIQLISITCRNDNLELYHRNFSKSLNYIMRELISEAGNYLIFK